MRSPPPLNLTAAAGGLIAANLAVHLIRLMLPPALDNELLVRFGFAPSLFQGMDGGWQLPAAPETWLSPLTYGFLHGDFLHLAVNTGFLLAFGTLVERRLGAWRFLAFYLLCTALAVIGTVLVYAVTETPVLIIGASGGVAGLFGAAARFAFSRPRLRLAAGLPAVPERISRGLLLAIVFIGMNLFFGLVGMTDFSGIRGLAWEAHIAGFIAGALLFPLFDRGPSAVLR